MSREREALKQYEALRGLVGGPSWNAVETLADGRSDDGHLRLVWREDCDCPAIWNKRTPKGWAQPVTDHEALCLWREHIRVYLHQHRDRVDVLPRSPDTGYAVLCSDWKQSRCFPDYDTALIEAAKAVEHGDCPICKMQRDAAKPPAVKP